MYLEFGKWEGSDVERLSGTDLWESERACTNPADRYLLREEQKRRRYLSKIHKWKAFDARKDREQ
jgi:hypothetical protein